MTAASDDLLTTRIWLIRHGEPDADSRGRCYGRLDVGLAPAGREQIQAVAKMLAAEPLSAIYASPRRRTRESAEILAQGRSCAIQSEERLREIDFGDFEGRTYDEIARSHPDLYRQWMAHPTETQFPNGESFRRMRERVLCAAREIFGRHRGQSIAVVSHGGVNRIILADVLAVPDDQIFRISQRFAAVNLVRWIGDYAVVEMVNARA